MLIIHLHMCCIYTGIPRHAVAVAFLKSIRFGNLNIKNSQQFNIVDKNFLTIYSSLNLQITIEIPASFNRLCLYTKKQKIS